MQNGYKILWTDNALSELQEAYYYLELNWTERELRNLSTELDRTLRLVSKNPKVFQKLGNKGVRKAVVKKHNTLYYRENEQDKTIEVLSFFSNRQNPKKLKV